MNLLILGSGNVTAQLTAQAVQAGHRVAAAMSVLEPDAIPRLSFDAAVVIGPECGVAREVLRAILESGRGLVVLDISGGAYAQWAAGLGLPTYPYPPLPEDLARLLEDLARSTEEVRARAADLYRRMQLGPEVAAALRMTRTAPIVAVTAPTGGVGKTTLAVNLAVLAGLVGYDVLFVDADGNAGAARFHFRMDEVGLSLIRMLREAAPDASPDSPMAALARGAAIRERAWVMPELPTLRVIPGFLHPRDLRDPAVWDRARVEAVMQTVAAAGLGGGGMVVLDVGINPSHPVHFAALNIATDLVIVMEPTIPSLALVYGWVQELLDRLREHHLPPETFFARVRLVFNKVLPEDRPQQLVEELARELAADGLTLPLTIHGLIPMAPPERAREATNSERREDILIWRALVGERLFARRPVEELEPFARAFVAFAAHLIPSLPSLLAAAGLAEPAAGGRRRGILPWRR
jgi:MinD-like ATPase involved in chromosome partitioning or flagellar assembly